MLDGDQKDTMKKLGKPFEGIEKDIAEGDGSDRWLVYANRLDEVFGFGYWTSEFISMHGNYFACKICLPAHYGTCRVGVSNLPNDAFIHACEQFGIGRNLSKTSEEFGAVSSTHP